MTCTLLLTSGAPQNLWVDPILTSIYLINLLCISPPFNCYSPKHVASQSSLPPPQTSDLHLRSSPAPLITYRRHHHHDVAQPSFTISLTQSATDPLNPTTAILHHPKAIRPHHWPWFDIKDLGPLRYFLGLQVTTKSTGIHLSQLKYAYDILVKHDLLLCKPASTPMPAKALLIATNALTPLAVSPPVRLLRGVDVGLCPRRLASSVAGWDMCVVTQRWSLGGRLGVWHQQEVEHAQVANLQRMARIEAEIEGWSRPEVSLPVQRSVFWVAEKAICFSAGEVISMRSMSDD
ncbi:hypothetical protein ACLB2K_059161 [Fragaria x ananassa]